MIFSTYDGIAVFTTAGSMATAYSISFTLLSLIPDIIIRAERCSALSVSAKSRFTKL